MDKEIIRLFKRKASSKSIALILVTTLLFSSAIVMPVRAGDGDGSGSDTVTEQTDPSTTDPSTTEPTVAPPTTKPPTTKPPTTKPKTIPSSKSYGTKYKKSKKYKGPAKWAKTISTLEKRSKKNKGKVIFVGSSSIRKWKSLQKDMAPIKTVNLGFGGSTVNDCVYYADRLIVPGKPKAIVFYAGTNDIAYGYSPSVVYRRTLDFFKYVHKALPGTKIYYIEQTRQPKRNKYWGRMKTLNTMVKNYAKKDSRVIYISTSKVLNTKKDKARKKYFLKDGLHFNKKGYAKWTSAIKPVLRRNLLK